MLVDLLNTHIDDQTDEDKLLLLPRPRKLHLHLNVGLLMVDQKVLVVIVQTNGRLLQLHGNRRADALKGLPEFIKKSETHDAAVLQEIGRQTGA